MIVCEQTVRLRKKERVCCVCKETIDIGEDMSFSVDYNHKTRKIKRWYTCMKCVDTLSNTNIDISSINEAYKESLNVF